MKTYVSRMTAFCPLRAPLYPPSGTRAFLRSASPITRLKMGFAEHLRRTGAPGSEAEASPEWIVLSHDHDLVAVDFIGGDSAEGSIPCLEDDDRDHERGGEGGGEGVSIFAGHLFGSCLGGEGPSPARQDLEGPKTG